MKIAELIVEAFDFLPTPLLVAFLAAFPVLELRGAIPVGIVLRGMHWLPTAIIAIAANIAIIPLIFWLLPRLEAWMRRWGRFDRNLDRFLARVRRSNKKSVERFEELAIFLLVALPIPGTGAWTGALVAYVFDLPRRATYLVMCAGVAAAGAAVTVLTMTGVGIFDLIHSLFF